MKNEKKEKGGKGKPKRLCPPQVRMGRKRRGKAGRLGDWAEEPAEEPGKQAGKKAVRKTARQAAEKTREG